MCFQTKECMYNFCEKCSYLINKDKVPIELRNRLLETQGRYIISSKKLIDIYPYYPKIFNLVENRDIIEHEICLYCEDDINEEAVYFSMFD